MESSVPVLPTRAHLCHPETQSCSGKWGLPDSQVSVSAIRSLPQQQEWKGMIFTKNVKEGEDPALPWGTGEDTQDATCPPSEP